MANFTNIKNLNNIGLQKICIDSSGTDKENVYVCDAEGFVLKFDKKSLLGDEKPEAFEIPDSTTASIAWTGSDVLVGYTKIDFVAGTEKQVVGRIENGVFDAESIVEHLEFQLNVTTVDANAENVAGGSSDYAVKLKSLKSTEAELKTRMLDGEPLCVKLDPKNEFLAVSTVDGAVTIIKIDSFSIAHTIEKAFPRFETIDVSKPLIQLSWSPDGKWLFVPSKDCVKSFRRGSWEDAGVYRLKDHVPAEFSVTATSRCGKYLAASSLDNQVAVWNFESMDIVSSAKFQRNAPGTTIITSIEFSPFSPVQLIIADSNKGICLFDAFGTSSKNSKALKTAEDVKYADKAGEDSDDDDSLLLNRTSAKRENLFGDEAMQDDEDTRMSSDLGAIKKQFGYGNDGLDGLEEFGFRLGEPEAPAPLSSDAPGAPVPIPMYSEPPPPRKVLIPERFVCNATPVDPDASERFLKYNRFGIVRSYVNESTKTSSIDIEFHNKNIHGDIHIDNFEYDYELADISLKVVALASLESRRKEKELDKATDELEELEEPKNQVKKGTSVLHVIPIQAFDSPRWSMLLPRGDGAVDVLCSSRQVVVLTKQRNIRVFTIGGLQRLIFTHPAPILTATCFEDRIAIASVHGAEFYEHKKTPQWRFEVAEYSLSHKSWYREPEAVKRFDLPVETGEQLDWLAYSSQGKLSVMDSLGNVHILAAPGLWVPVFQGSSVLRDPSDSIFPVGVTAKEFRYIYCRGARAPMVRGINPPTSVEWKLPFCQPESVRTEMEHDLFLGELQLAESLSDGDTERSAEEAKKLTKQIVKLFALLVKTNADGQAAEVAALVAGGSSSTAASKTINSLCSYASKCKKVALAQKVAEIGRMMDEEEEEDVEEPRRSVLNDIRPARRIAMGGTKKKATEERQRSEEPEEREEEPEEMSSQQMESVDLNESTQPIRTIERSIGAAAKNPFAKGSSATQASLSIFDQLETSAATSNLDHRKRARENEQGSLSSQLPARKQAKLNFGASSSSSKKQPPQNRNEKENDRKEPDEESEAPVKKSVSPYDLWLSESKTRLLGEFDGEEADFTKFCIQSFRALSKEQKEEWKAKAQAAN